MITQHTPTPWALGRGTVTQIFAVDLNGEEYCPEGGTLDDNHVAAVKGIYGNFAEQAQANAAFIVRACNNHDALVEKLQAQFKAVDWLMAKLIEADPTFMPSKSPIWDSIKGTNEVLAAAGAA